MRYAVASDFNGAACYFTSAFNVDREKGFVPIVDLRKESAFAPGDHGAAKALAEGLSDLCRILPPNDARTWFVVELPEQPR